MRIEELYHQLIELARERVRAGQVTERGLARRCGVSQPHLHNVLKNIRTLSAGSADRLMQALEINVPELIWRFPCDLEGSGVRAVPIVRNKIGPGSQAVLTAFRGYAPFPENLIKGLVQPVAARLAPDLAIPKAFAANDLVLLDQSEILRGRPGGTQYWVVADGGGLRVRYVKLGGSKLYLVNDATGQNPQSWQSIPLQGKNILDIVRARIVWIGREMDAAAPG